MLLANTNKNCDIYLLLKGRAEVLAREVRILSRVIVKFGFQQFEGRLDSFIYMIVLLFVNHFLQR